MLNVKVFGIATLLAMFWFVPQGRSQAPAVRTIDQSTWEKASGNLDYSNDVPQPQKQRKPREPVSGPNIDFSFKGLDTILLVLGIVLLIALIGYGLYTVLDAPSNRMLARDGTEITLENVEQYLHESDLDRFLREALTKQDYNQAVRLYYLKIIKNLSEQGAIDWAKEKTNRDYLREMQHHTLAQPFRAATQTYEYIWYGNQRLSAWHFGEMEVSLMQLLEQTSGVKTNHP
jgi:Domain of unknown function (DUF4129)